MKTSRSQRNSLIRTGYEERRKGGGLPDVAEAVVSRLFNEEQFNTEDMEAIEVSDYAYGVAAFVCKGEDW